MTHRLHIYNVAKGIGLFIFSLFFLITVNFGVSGCQKKEGKPQSTSLSQLPVPSEADIALFEGMMKHAQEALREAKEKGDKEQARREVREFNHYRSAVSHARKMRTAYLEMCQAEKAGDKEKAASKLHVYYHYRGELHLLAQSADATLASKIREWTE